MFVLMSDKEGYYNAQQAVFADATFAILVSQKAKVVPGSLRGIIFPSSVGGILIAARIATPSGPTKHSIMMWTSTQRPIHLIYLRAI